MFDGIPKAGDLSHLWIHRNQWIWTLRRMANIGERTQGHTDSKL